MANLVLQSPGIQLSESSSELIISTAAPTTVFVAGFAAQGPSSEPTQVSSISEFQQIFGLPTNAAERYFYYSVAALFNSSANVLVYRLPYGPNSGIGYSSNYSALVYPVVSYVSGASATNLALPNSTYFFGAPTHVVLSQSDYISVSRGNAFTWQSNTSGAATFGTATDGSFGTAGLIILNEAQTTIDQCFQGFYVGIIDNSDINPATSYLDINNVLTVNTTAANVVGNAYVAVPNARLGFALSASSYGVNNSVSEVMENIPPFNIFNPSYSDTIALGLFKLNQTVFSTDVISLQYSLVERYTASLDYFRQINSTNGGAAQSFFLGNVTNPSTNVQVLINPYISNQYTSTWLNLSGNPSKAVRFLSSPKSIPLATDTATTYQTRIGAPSGMYASFLGLFGSTDALFALGDYSLTNLTTKLIGNLPLKVSTMMESIADPSVYPFNVSIEAGLGTIYENSLNPATYGYFDDSIPYDSDIQALTAQGFGGNSIPNAAQNYVGIINQYINLAQYTRQDHIFIADPIVNIFVQNGTKVLDNPNNTFSSNIYWPLRNLYSTVDTSYACVFGTAVQVIDIVSNRQVWVPFSGFAAAAFANTDSNYYPWYAPAGFTRGIITGPTDIAFYPNQKQRDQMYNISINPLAFFPGEGFVMFGQKTLQALPSAFDRINVRRMFLYLENAVKAVLQYFLFEPNNLFTRNNIINTVTPIYQYVQNTSGIDQFLIICNETNNTPTVIDENALVLDQYVSATRTAEFILANFISTATGVNLTELANQ